MLDNPRAIGWYVGELRFYGGDREVKLSGPYHFTSAWMSAGTGQEWVSVDLGAPSTFDRVALRWLRRPAEGTVQASDDGATWRAVMPLPASSGWSDDLKLERPAKEDTL